jgi:protein involved in polysaccharide export with SLBB domain
VYVAGEVRNPGLYRVPPGARADDAVWKAGSFTNQADRAAVNLAEVVQDGEEIRVPKIGEGAASKKKPARKKRSHAGSSRAPLASVDLKMPPVQPNSRSFRAWAKRWRPGSSLTARKTARSLPSMSWPALRE